MAHADYDCCAICDEKQEYTSACKAKTKEDICQICQVKIYQVLGLICPKPAVFISHLEGLSDATVLRALHDIGYSPCYYPNELDDYLIKRGFVETKSTNPEAKWGKRLKPVKMKIKVTECKGVDLQPGDLFTTAPQAYWDIMGDNGAIGEKVYIRTNTPASYAPDAGELIYKVEITR